MSVMVVKEMTKIRKGLFLKTVVVDDDDDDDFDESTLCETG